MSDKLLFKDYNLFQQDNILNGLDIPQQTYYKHGNLIEFILKPANIGETIQCKLTSLSSLFTEYLFELDSQDGYNIPLLISHKQPLYATCLINAYNNYNDNTEINLALLEKGLFSSCLILYERLNGIQIGGQPDHDQVSPNNNNKLKQLLRMDFDPLLTNIGAPMKLKVFMPGVNHYMNSYYVDTFNNIKQNEEHIEKFDKITDNKNSLTKAYAEIEVSSHNYNQQNFSNKTANVDIFNQKMVKLVSKAPIYDRERGVYLLKMNERVQLSSALNLQLVHESNPNYIVLQLGRYDKNTFTCDYSYPMNALQAFTISLGCLQRMNLLFSQ